MGSKSARRRPRRESRWQFHWTEVAADAAGRLTLGRGGSCSPFAYQRKCVRHMAHAAKIAPAACVLSPWMPAALCPVPMQLAPDWRLVCVGGRPVAIVWRRENAEPYPVGWADIPF